MLTKREEDILKVIIGEYISTAAPVGSETIARKYPLDISPATIRNEMARLEGEGYIIQPHHSAGRIPSEKGYRRYVETLMGNVELSQSEQCLIRHQFYQVASELDQWLGLGATILAHLVHNIAIVTWPKAIEPRLRHLELLSLREFHALLVLILEEARLRQQVITLNQALSQQELGTMAGRLSHAFVGLTTSEIKRITLDLSPVEEQVVAALVRIMEAEEGRECDEPYVSGLHYVLGQPEFASADKALAIAEMFEERGLLRSILLPLPVGEGLRVVIGKENKEQIMHHCTVVLSCYGLPGEVTGVIGVLGPTRMHYERTVSAVRFLSTTMSELVSRLYG
jgi:heat-inducible transcriptional repressor